MEGLTGEALRQVGPYWLLTEVAPSSHGMRWAVGSSGTAPEQLVVLMFPPLESVPDDGYSLRLWAEVNNFRRVTGTWFPTLADAAPPTSPSPWAAYECAPALSLSTALSRAGEALSEQELLGLAATLAQCLLTVHAQGLVFAGLTPDSVLVTPHGVRLTGYGLVRAATPEGDASDTVPGVSPEMLPPEHHPGGTPTQAGDIYSLGKVLACAATGRTGAASAEMPDTLGRLVADTLAATPEQRPRADVLAQRFRAVKVSPQGAPPPSLVSVIDGHAKYCGVHTGPTGPRQPEGPGKTGEALQQGVPGFSASRRRALISIGAGAAGIAVGAGAVASVRKWASDGPTRRPSLSLRGTAPDPLWRYELDDSSALDQYLILDGTHMMLSGNGATVLDLRSGKKVWSRGDLYADGPPISFDGDSVLLAENGGIRMVSAHSGKVKWLEERYANPQSLRFSKVLGRHGNTLLILCEKSDSIGADGDYVVVSYRVSDRKELWRHPIPADFAEDMPAEDDESKPEVQSGELLLPNTAVSADGHKFFSYLAIDAETGRQSWRRKYSGIDRLTKVQTISGDEMLCVEGHAVRLFGIHSGKEHWSFPVKGSVDSQVSRSGPTGYISTTAKSGVYAIDLRTGAKKWRSRFPIPNTGYSPGVAKIGAQGRTVFCSMGPEVNAIRARDGALVWRMGAVESESGISQPEVLGTARGMVLISSKSAVYAVPGD